MNKNISNEKGLTLIELLAVVVITAIFSIILFSILTKSIENTRIISEETMLRDEADIIVSRFIKTLYSTRQDHIIRNTTSGGDSYLEVTTDLSKCKRDDNGIFLDLNGNKLSNDSLCKPTLKPIGFKTENGVTKLHILDEQYALSNSRIKLLPDSKINGDPLKTSIYEIVLALEITHIRGNQEKTREITFKNEIQPIVQKK